MMDKSEAINLILDYFKTHENEFNSAIEELDNYNGYLADDRYYEMEELEDVYAKTSPIEILQRAFFGYDEQYGMDEPFNPNRDFFRFNAYGNLVSADYKDYSDRLDEYFAEDYIDNVDNCYDVPDYVQEIVDNIE